MKLKPKPAPEAPVVVAIPLSARIETVETCGTCQWWRQVEGLPKGRCKRFPPVPMLSAGAMQPFTDAGDCCGEHRERAA